MGACVTVDAAPADMKPDGATAQGAAGVWAAALASAAAGRAGDQHRLGEGAFTLSGSIRVADDPLKSWADPCVAICQ